MRVYVLFLATLGYGASQTTAPPSFGDLAARVQGYLTLRERAQSSLPRQKPTKEREQIVGRQTALAGKIREARASAKQGDIFSPVVSLQFKQVIQTAFHGTSAASLKKTISEGEPVKGWRISVNENYPENLPLTTVPPTLLLRLPQLPKELAYHILGRDFVMLDTEANIVVDFIPDALPATAVP